MPTAAFCTLGCKLNQYETEAVREKFLSHGYEVVPFGTGADVYVINTCAVTAKSDRSSRQMIHRALRASPGALVVATGCSVQTNPGSFASIPGVGLVLGNLEKPRILDFLSANHRPQRPLTCVSAPENLAHFEDFDISCFGGYTRAFIKIQDGCDGGCSYCIVPLARGPSRSRNPESVIAQAERLARQGYQEIVLTGVNLGRYGLDLQLATSLVDVLKSLISISGLHRIRLSSIEPSDISPELIDLLANSSKICRHLHIPLQSGDSEILQAMNRDYTPTDYRQLIETLVEKIPGVGIGADVMVGFPGESDRHFRRSYEFVESLRLAYLHVFNYSQRPRTPAAALPDQVSAEVRKERSRHFRELRARKMDRFRQSFLGRRLQVLLEKRKDRETGMLTGLADNYLRVLVDGGDELMGQMVEAEFTKVVGDKNFGRLRKVV